MERIVDLSAPDAFALISDFSAHERWIPLTTITVPPGPLAEGHEIVACSAKVLDDRMRVDELTPPAGSTPGVLRMRKLGPVLLGEATITVAPIGPDSSTIRWEADLWLAGPLPAGVTRAILGPTYAAMLALAFRGIQRDASALAAVRDRRRATRDAGKQAEA